MTHIKDQLRERPMSLGLEGARAALAEMDRQDCVIAEQAGLLDQAYNLIGIYSCLFSLLTQTPIPSEEEPEHGNEIQARDESSQQL